MHADDDIDDDDDADDYDYDDDDYNDDDADNDVLYIKGLKVFTSAEITIINRNGQVVYESGRGYKNNWDGTNKGSNPSFGTNQLPEGIYFFVFKFNGQNRQPISGNIYIKP